MKKLTMKKPNRESISASFHSRSFRAGGYSLVAAVVVIAIAVIINLAANAIPSKYTKLDVTSAGLYSLSDQTTQVVTGLKSDVTVYWLVRDGKEDSTLEHLLDRYEGLSSHLKVVKKDPVVYPAFAKQYTSEDIYDNSLIVVSGDRSRYIAESSIFVSDYSNYDTSGSVSTQFAGESELTSAVNYVVSQNLPIIYTLTGHGESDLPETLQNAITKENMDCKSLSLLTQSQIPADCNCLMIYSPQRDITDTEKNTLLSYLTGGGKLFLVTDYSAEDLPNLMALMGNYGVTKTDGVVLEGNSNNHLQGYSYYLLPDIQSHDITKPLMDGGYYVLMPAAQGLKISDNLRDGLNVTSLLQTSDSAYSKTNVKSMTTYDKEAGDVNGPFSLGVAISETLDKGTTQIVWLTSSQMFASQADTVVSGGNTDLFLNSLDWMCQLENSISIRAKNLNSENLIVPSSASAIWTLVLVGIIPLAFLGVGAYTVIKRRRA